MLPMIFVVYKWICQSSSKRFGSKNTKRIKRVYAVLVGLSVFFLSSAEKKEFVSRKNNDNRTIFSDRETTKTSYLTRVEPVRRCHSAILFFLLIASIEFIEMNDEFFFFFALTKIDDRKGKNTQMNWNKIFHWFFSRSVSRDFRKWNFSFFFSCHDERWSSSLCIEGSKKVKENISVPRQSSSSRTRIVLDDGKSWNFYCIFALSYFQLNNQNKKIIPYRFFHIDTDVTNFILFIVQRSICGTVEVKRKRQAQIEFRKKSFFSISNRSSDLIGREIFFVSFCSSPFDWVRRRCSIATARFHQSK